MLIVIKVQMIESVSEKQLCEATYADLFVLSPSMVLLTGTKSLIKSAGESLSLSNLINMFLTISYWKITKLVYLAF